MSHSHARVCNGNATWASVVYPTAAVVRDDIPDNGPKLLRVCERQFGPSVTLCSLVSSKASLLARINDNLIVHGKENVTLGHLLFDFSFLLNACCSCCMLDTSL